MPGAPSPALYTLLAARAADDPAAPAILAPAFEPLTFGALIEHIAWARSWLNDRGFGVGDRIALLAPRGPDTAVAGLAVMCAAACVPLNPLATATECEETLAQTSARALLAPAGVASPARDVARRLGLALFEWSVDPGAPAGLFGLRDSGQARRVLSTRPASGDIALVIRTSGTTSEPKIVPTSHGNLVARAEKAQRMFGLERSDRCLNLMPLCYTHGLSSALIGALGSGGSVICPTHFDVEVFLACLRDLEPTWYSAAASYHQVILDWLRERPDAARAHRLRFVRSSSSPLPVSVQGDLEQVLGVPVVEAYGTTEAGTVCANPPHGRRKRGTVGSTPDGDVAVADDVGLLLPPGSIGEVVIRGVTVVAGYEGGDPEVNRATFRDGWYRTGDLGTMDADGYLTIVGRVKEMINRGGEKISPAEVDAALLEHPAVAEAVTFAVPHPTLGEEVAAAVTLQPGRGATERDLRRFLFYRLTPFKVPRRVVLAHALPKGPTGKPLRQGLAEHFGLSLVTGRSAAPDGGSSPMERILLALFREVLHDGGLGPDDDFFMNGGDSLAAVEMISRIEDELDVGLPLLALIKMPTARLLATSLLYQPPGAPRDVIAVNAGGRQRPVFGIGGRYGHAVHLLLVGRAIGPDQPLYGLQPPGMDWDAAGCGSISEMAGHYVDRIRAIQPRGPYRLLGVSFGGLMVFEMALQLQDAGEDVEFLGLMDTHPPAVQWRGRTERAEAAMLAEDEEAEFAPRGEVEADGVRVARAHVEARNAYALARPFRGELTYFYCAGEAVAPKQDRRPLWRRFATAGIRLLAVPGLHAAFHEEPQFSVFCGLLRASLAGTAPPSARAAQVFGRRYHLERGSEGEVIRGADGRVFPVAAGGAWGGVESATVEGRTFWLRGWAADVERREPAEAVLVFLDGRYAGRSEPGVHREDLERTLSAPGLRYAGFLLRVPWLSPAKDRMPRVRVFALSRAGVAGEVRCDPVSGPEMERSQGGLHVVVAMRDREIRRLQGVLDEAVVVRDAEIRRLQEALDEATRIRDAEILRLRGVLDEAVAERDAEIFRLRGVLDEAVAERDAEILRLQGVLGEAVAERDAENRRLQGAHDAAVAVRDGEIHRLHGVLEEAVTVRDAEIRRLQGVLEEAVTVRDHEIRRLQRILEELASGGEKQEASR